ncbi:MAG TPA: long-chain fatty acid--CoA ligase [bacterium]|nr:long-chain fatty acid--CoA ligase [bacterium]HOL47676.1 long-chain fatty acid--CoA ligase [bacterium]HPQ18700.1 long-chain fatty acid--CoA ligase [bacterium]
MIEKIENNIVNIFLNRVEKYKNKTFIKYQNKNNEWLELSYFDFYNSALNFAKGLQLLGIEKNDIITIISENRLEWLISDMAILFCNAINAAYYDNASSSELEYVINNAKPKFIILSNNHQLLKVLRIPDIYSLINYFIIFDYKDEYKSNKKILSFNDVYELGKEKGNNEKIFETLKSINENNVITLIFTSGSGGLPKGAMLTHKNIVEDIKRCSHRFFIPSDFLFLSFLPLSHSFERTTTYYFSIYSGATIAICQKPLEVINNIKEVKPDIVISVPRLFEKFYKKFFEKVNNSNFIQKTILINAIKFANNISDYFINYKPLPFFKKIIFLFLKFLVYKKIYNAVGGNIKYFISGGAPLNSDIIKFFWGIGLKIFEGYGLTECSPVVSVNYENNIKLGSVGKPLPDIEIKLADDNELLIHAPIVMKGYFNNEIATKEIIDSDNWLHTGDIVKIDDDGYIYIIGRKKDIIITSTGYNISPADIEMKFLNFKEISQVCLIGDKYKYPVLLIVPNFDFLKLFTLENSIIYQSIEDLLINKNIINIYKKIIKQVNKELNQVEKIRNFKLLSKEFTIDDALLTPTLKIKRTAIYNKYINEIKKLYKDEVKDIF